MAGLFAALSLGLGHRSLAAFDAAVSALALAMQTPELTRFMRLATALGSGEVQLALALAVAAWVLRAVQDVRGPQRSWLRLTAAAPLLALAGAFGLNAGLKFLFQRVRPSLFPLAPAVGYSYPSGHAMSAITFYAVAAYVVSTMLVRSRAPVEIWSGEAAAAAAGPRPTRREQGRGWSRVMAALSAAATLLVGLSRVYLGVHYASDVLGGYLAGGAWTCLALAWLGRAGQGAWGRTANGTESPLA